MAHNKWLENEKQIIVDNYSDMTDEGLADLLPRHSLKSVETMRKRLGCTRSHSKYSFEVALEYINKKGYIMLSNEDEYKDVLSSLRYICPKHGERITTLGHLLEGKGCLECGLESTISKKRTDVALRKNEDIMHCQRLDLEYIETYRRIKDDGWSEITVRYICNKHREKGVQEVLRSTLYKAVYCCNYCSLKRYSHKDLQEKLVPFEENFEFLSNDYSKMSDKILCRCKKHNIIENKNIRDVLLGHGCYKCGIEKYSNARKLSDIQLEEKINKINSDVRIIGEYQGANSPVLIECKKCGCTWSALTNSLLRCPSCDYYFKGEKLTADYLRVRDIEFISQYKFDDCKRQKRLSFDFFLPNDNICIEYNGKQHYSACKIFGGQEKFAIQQERDKIKREYCENKGIKLIEIPYTINTKTKIEIFLDKNL